MKFIALFRGINVGGKNIVKMAELREMLAGLGVEKVQTYIQSGNATFDASDNPVMLKEKIETAFADTFGFGSTVILRTGNEIAAIAEKPPFSAELVDAAIAANPNVEHVYIYFMDTMPSEEHIRALQAEYAGRDKLRIGVRELFLLCHESIRDSKLAAALSKLNTPMTARNWKTLNKLHLMLKE